MGNKIADGIIILPVLDGIPRKSKKVGEKKRAKKVSGKIFLMSVLLRDLSELEIVKTEVKNGNIVILNVIPLARKSIEDVKRAVLDLREFARSVEGDIARLGEERVIVCPSNVKIRRRML